MKHIQNGKYHQAQKYIDEIIRNKRKTKSLKIGKLQKVFDEIDESKTPTSNERPCKCPTCHKNVTSRVIPFREELSSRLWKS